MPPRWPHGMPTPCTAQLASRAAPAPLASNLPLRLIQNHWLCNAFDAGFPPFDQRNSLFIYPAATLPSWSPPQRPSFQPSTWSGIPAATPCLVAGKLHCVSLKTIGFVTLLCFVARCDVAAFSTYSFIGYNQARRRCCCCCRCCECRWLCL